MERIGTDKMRPGGKGARQFIEDSRIAKMILKLTGVIGVALVMSGMTLKNALSVQVLIHIKMESLRLPSLF